MVKAGPALMVATHVDASMEAWHRPRWHAPKKVVWKAGTNTMMVKAGPAPMVATHANASMEKWHRPRWNAHLEWDLNPEAPKVE
jgi:hypothetical protein